jgi:REP element-mobilizing transposase RayT
MTMPRRQLVDVAVTHYYRCISCCVRRAFLCGEGVTHRKAWVEARLEVLAKHFAVSVCGIAILDNHLHVLCRLTALMAVVREGNRSPSRACSPLCFHSSLIPPAPPA